MLYIWKVFGSVISFGSGQWSSLSTSSSVRFEANQARLQMGVLAYNLLHMIRQF